MGCAAAPQAGVRSQSPAGALRPRLVVDRPHPLLRPVQHTHRIPNLPVGGSSVDPRSPPLGAVSPPSAPDWPSPGRWLAGPTLWPVPRCPEEVCTPAPLHCRVRHSHGTLHRQDAQRHRAMQEHVHGLLHVGDGLLAVGPLRAARQDHQEGEQCARGDDGGRSHRLLSATGAQGSGMHSRRKVRATEVRVRQKINLTRRRRLV